MRYFTLFAATVMSLSYAYSQANSGLISDDSTKSVTQQVTDQSIVGNPIPTSAEDNKTKKKVELKPYGFVRNYFYYDSRQTYNSNSGLFVQIPKDEDLSFERGGERYDKNSEAESNFLAITTRLGLNASAKLNKTDLFAKIEADFCGATGYNFLLRLRQAYFRLDWMNSEHKLLLGQAWHPMTGDLPDVLALASGSPFQPFSRSPQVRYDFKPGKMNLTVAALWQYQYKSVGPAGYDIKYNKIPEWFVGLDFSNNGFKIGTGLDIFIQTPRVSATSGDTVWGVDEKVAGFSPILYTNYHVDKFTVKAKCVFGQNTAHLSQYSGFGATKENPDGSYDYKPMRNLSVWGDVSYGTTWKVNLFGGYFKNFGLSDELVGNLLYMRSSVKNLDYAWRLCPAVSFNRKGLSVGLEYEFTDAGYGDGFDEYAKVEAERDVVNHRICCMLKYAW